MKDKERPILYISLALNLILAVLLIMSYSRDPEPTTVAALPTSNQPPGENPASPTPTHTPIPRPSETSAPTATEPPAATEEPSPTLPPSPTPTGTPAPTPTQTPTPSPTPIPQPDWLIYLNSF